ERAEKENALLGEEGDEKKRYGRTNQCPDDAIDALRQYLPALLRLRYDEDGEQRPIGLVEVEGEGDEQREQGRGRCLCRKDPGNPFRTKDCLGRAEIQLCPEWPSYRPWRRPRNAPTRNLASSPGSPGGALPPMKESI